MCSLNNKQFLRSLPFYDNNLDTFLKKPRIKKDVVIKSKTSNKQKLRNNKYKKSNIFKYALPFSNDYVNRNYYNFYLFIIMNQKNLKENLKIINIFRIKRLED